MSIRVGFLDLIAAVVVAVVVFLPAREYSAQSLIGLSSQENVPSLMLAQAKWTAKPSGTTAADFAKAISVEGLRLSDLAIRVTGSATEGSVCGQWKAFAAQSEIFAGRAEFATALQSADKAMTACESAAEQCTDVSEACPPYQRVHLEMLRQEVETAIAAQNSGIDPQKNLTKFREQMKSLRAPYETKLPKQR